MPPYPFVSKLYPDVEIFEVFVITSLQRNCGRPLGIIPGTMKSFTFLGETFLSILRRCTKYLSQSYRISSVTLIIPSFSSSSWVLIRCSSRTRQIQRTIPLSADVKRRIVSLDAGHVLQPYSKLILIQELKILPRFLSEIMMWLNLYRDAIYQSTC